MQTEQLVQLEWVGHRQTLRIPREFELVSDAAVIRKEGDRLIVEPVSQPSLLTLLATLQPIEEDFPDVDAGLPPLNDVVFSYELPLSA